MKERDFQIKFSRWLRYRWDGSGAFELKICQRPSLPFSSVQPHQVEALLAVKHGGMEYKIPDDTIGQKPFDCFRLSAPAFVGVLYYSRGVSQFYLIDIDRWVQEVHSSERKSLTEVRASEIGTRHEFS